MSQEIYTAALDYVDKTGEALFMAQKLAEQQMESTKRASQAAVKLSDDLQRHELIPAQEKEAAIRTLTSHDGALQVVGNLVAYIGTLKQAHQKELAVTGQGSGEKVANATKVATVTGGRRLGLGERSQADVAYLQALGLGHLVN